VIFGWSGLHDGAFGTGHAQKELAFTRRRAHVALPMDGFDTMTSSRRYVHQEACMIGSLEDTQRQICESTGNKQHGQNHGVG